MNSKDREQSNSTDNKENSKAAVNANKRMPQSAADTPPQAPAKDPPLPPVKSLPSRESSMQIFDSTDSYLPSNGQSRADRPQQPALPQSIATQAVTPTTVQSDYNSKPLPLPQEDIGHSNKSRPLSQAVDNAKLKKMKLAPRQSSLSSSVNELPGLVTSGLGRFVSKFSSLGRPASSQSLSADSQRGDAQHADNDDVKSYNSFDDSDDSGDDFSINGGRNGDEAEFTLDSSSSNSQVLGPRVSPFVDGPIPPRKQDIDPVQLAKSKRASTYRHSSLAFTSNNAASNSSTLGPDVSNVNINDIPQVSLPGYTPHNEYDAQARTSTDDGNDVTVGGQSNRYSQYLAPPMNSASNLMRRLSQSFTGFGNGGANSSQSMNNRPLSSIQQDVEASDMTRRRSLVRPERARMSSNVRPRSVLLAGGGIGAAAYSSQPPTLGRSVAVYNHSRKDPYQNTWWTRFSDVVTFYAPNFVLAGCCGKKTVEVQRAWREKMGLVTIIVFLIILLGFITFGFQYFACNIFQNVKRYPVDQFDSSYVRIRGDLYDIRGFNHPGRSIQMYQVSGKDVSWLFPVSPDSIPGGSACAKIPGVSSVNTSCTVDDAIGNVSGYCHTAQQFAILQNNLNIVGQAAFDWDTVKGGDNYIVYSGQVLDLKRYFQLNNKFLGQEFTQLLNEYIGKDITHVVQRSTASQERMACLLEQFRAGYLDSIPIGCFASQAFTFVSLGTILAVIVARFVLALLFLWTDGRTLGKYPPGGAPQQLNKSTASAQNSQDDTYNKLKQEGIELSPAVLAALEAKKNNTFRNSLMPTKSRFSHQYNLNTPQSKSKSYRPSPLSNKKSNISVHQDYPGILRTIMLVTCYSEDEKSLRNSLDSLACTEFPDTHKMLFIISDGLITGSGNAKSTPETLIDMIELDQQFVNPPLPYSYVAIADGAKRHNMAQVYAGRYRVDGHVVPTVLVVKCGTPEEKSDRKPGNRGKRDSQILLMNFLQKVLFNDRMTPMEFDLFTKMTAVTSSVYQDIPLNHLDVKITPDMYELVLMVDADTKVFPDALTPMSYAMANDPKIIGLCGETQIANKGESWVTAIQVFEYYLAHFLSKSFESVFGSCTCLPGCFSMYRVRAPKGESDAKSGLQHFVPILANPDIVEAYSENVVETLHAKNLLLLGEDRYLTTLMLKTFPKRKLVFVPRAKCKTEVPSTFKVLLSQRRRWINSTVHNLLELVLVRDLCGIFCFSMQFVIFMELIGTAVLPAAICFTIYLLIISFFVTPPPIIPLALLAAILGSPALLIVFTSTKRYSFLLWMIIYLFSLPIWNFVLPAYAYMHFDDFTWGQTRQLKGGDANHDSAEGEFDPSKIVMKKWSEWERERYQQETLKGLSAGGKSRTVSENQRKSRFKSFIASEVPLEESDETDMDNAGDTDSIDDYSRSWNPEEFIAKLR
ncbi:hypothetical protein MP228_000291 [Amoeboaphelidium protococcarum]|nr:hypothetical protein MP228_000291 [Amoeboaphelidium protococcarum]